MKLYIFILIILLGGCKPDNNNLEKQFPIHSQLTFDKFAIAERVMIDSDYCILQINAKHGSEFYEPYLLFYNIEDLKLEAYYYNPGKVTSIKNKTISGYYNQYRGEKTKEKLKNGYNYLFESQEPTDVDKKFQGNVLSYEIKSDSLYLKVKDFHLTKSLKYNINDIIFSDVDKDSIEVYVFSDSRLTHKYYKVSRSDLKEYVWKKIIIG
jgi:hypothetical protein